MIAAVCGIAFPAASRIYRNSEFGITVPVPKETLPCFTPADEHDHGPTILLGTADPKACASLEQIESHRYVDIFASYNADDDTKRLLDFLNSECVGVASTPCGRAPEGLRVTGLRSASARVNERDGWIDIIVVTQAGKPDPTFDPTVPLINYEINLHTKPPYLDEDLRVFREVLRTIRISPPN